MTKPPPDPWTVAIHRSDKDLLPIGAGVVIDDSLVLTCEHVVCKGGTLLDEIWIAFPKAPTVSWSSRRRVRALVHNGRPEHNLDVVLLQLDEPVPGVSHPRGCAASARTTWPTSRGGRSAFPATPTSAARRAAWWGIPSPTG
ncbi:trypsin-like serine protease [Phytohabitans houttuyneae]|uniref:Peptidase S1 domain-containing protein n=1 Tax=Phytohabitans houttuyneae TaxID=1076126 RepID=A0A6V8KLS5_9ACTN|nr:trypsin-like serine protease [Phytohabitans houttuyneae]GFJ86073.1 hypothetical protein Phou_102530 [Phytohabitans houttuyneae]